MEQEEVESGDNIEVFIKFNTILSPIAEESFSEEHSCQNTPERCVQNCSKYLGRFSINIANEMLILG